MEKSDSPPAPDPRAERLKAALRANLHKRKARERADEAAPGDPGPKR